MGFAGDELYQNVGEDLQPMKIANNNLISTNIAKIT